MSNIFVNLEARNDTTSPQEVTVREVREPVVLPNPDQYTVAIDRFSIHKAWLPIFEDVHQLQIKLVRKSDSAAWTETLDFSAKTDANGMLWDVNDVLDVINAHLTALCVNPGITAPTMSYSLSTGKGALDYSAQAGFADDYELRFNEPLYSIYSTFDYVDVVFDQDFFKLNLVDAAPHTMTSTDELNLSPVSKIYIKSNNMPLVYEYTPEANNNRASEAILTDFEFNGANRFPLQNINYTATTGQYRFHSLTDATNFSVLQLQFYYKTFGNNSYSLYFLPSGSVNVKLFFRPISR